MGRASLNDAEQAGPSAATRALADWIVSTGVEDIGAVPRAWATDAVLDWFGVTVAGSREPLSHIVSETMGEEGSGPARLIGRENALSPLNAALVNGAASHALDYDDVNSRMLGHPTVPLVPALLAISDMQPVSGRAFLEAFIVGYEAEVLTAEMIGQGHYDLGWHMTATVGTVGAAAASARLLGLNAVQTAHALGLAVAQAAGLKSMFGTMSKPFQVGKAAMNGLMAARLAEKGMTSRTDAIECAQGLADTQSDGFFPVEMTSGGNRAFAVEENLFKYHAACYLTHSPIEAARRLRELHSIAPDAVERATIEVNKGALTVCNIERPETGLEIKFSLKHTVGLALSGMDTGDLDTYSDENAQDEMLLKFGERSMVVGIESDIWSFGRVKLDLKNGASVEETQNVGVPASDQPEQRRRLLAKFRTVSEPVLGIRRSDELADSILSLDDISDASILSEMAQPN
ncbi:MmgE/PrpD family protein [Nisaea sp.]|uniref:MmgE/PrpD family protein n=1 Tax=Nisaea sp. TaxID=2024842 RepID=UPI0032671BAE